MAADKAIMCYVQEGHVSNSQYFERFNALVDMALSNGSSISHSKALVNSELVGLGTDQDNATTEQKAKALELVQKLYLSMLMLDGMNYHEFRDLREELDNDFAKGSDTYPTNRNVILHLLNSIGRLKPSGDSTTHGRTTHGVCKSGQVRTGQQEVLLMWEERTHHHALSGRETRSWE